jgi:predicted TIM-barrel fold metal-dependent hydrolase
MILNHCHVMPEGTFKKDDPLEGSIARLKVWMQELGFEKAVAFAPFYYQMKSDPNQWLLDALAGETSICGYATINPSEPDAPDRLQRFVAGGFVGAKVHPPIFKIRIDDPAIDPFFQVAEELRIPVQFHTGVHGWLLRKYEPILLDDLAQQHPKLPIIIGHVGGAAFFDQALAVLQNNRNTYAELAQTRRAEVAWHLSPDRIKTLLRYVGPDRIIYGADYPYNNLDVLRDDVAWVRSWGLPRDAEEKILGGTLARLIEKKT